MPLGVTSDRAIRRSCGRRPPAWWRSASWPSFRLAAGAIADLAVTAYPALLAVIMGQHPVRPNAPAHPRIAILGQLESRLVQADLVIVGGLNEGVWPRNSDAGPWLNRAMRVRLGLPPVEQAIGAAAHDLVALACAPEVLLTRARKDEVGAPTTASRWLARLDATLRASGLALADTRRWGRWVRLLDEPVAERWPVPALPPQPRPPRATRPRELWATDIERLMRDPYGFYARSILRLRPLEPIDAEPGGAERGQLLHAILAAFARRCDEGWPDDPQTEIRRIGRRHFAPLEHRPELWAFWWPRFEAIADWMVDVERERRLKAARVLGELRGAAGFATDAGTFTLRARADRVEALADGTVVIVDHKTGRAPDRKEVDSGRSPQLLIEALIARAGGFELLGRSRPRGAAIFRAAWRHASGRDSRCLQSADAGADAACERRAGSSPCPFRRSDDRLCRHSAALGDAIRGRLRPSRARRRVARRRRSMSIDAPTETQRRSADPRRSVWVTANAGTGKTRVLSDRLLRLLLSGEAPESILAITFTKAAAAEMTSRVGERLAAWASASQDELAGELEALVDAPPTAEQLDRAQRLFGRVLDLPRGLSIMTIHGLCGAILRRFPLEAGIAPHFETIDERTASELLIEAREEVMARAPIRRRPSACGDRAADAGLKRRLAP